MKYFVLRNSTIENILGLKDFSYSGYNDISFLDTNAQIYIWFYLLPYKTERNLLSSEVESYYNNIELVYNLIPEEKTLIIFTLNSFYSPKFQASDFRVEESISNFNNRIYKLALEKNNVKILDFNEFITKYPQDQIIDWKYYFISKMQINPKLAPAFRIWFDRKIEEIELKRKKCLVLDLDNTLWGGILGEDGIDGIKIGGDFPGNAFHLFQEFLVELGKNGIILTICSKNNEQDVLNLWKKNPFIVLKKEHIAAYRINWNNKAQNIKELSEELNIGLDSFVFLDDNPTERDLIKQLLPQVEVPIFPDKPYLLPQFAQDILTKYFTVYSITKEDKNKTEQYKANTERANAQKSFSDFTAYLKSLEIELSIDSANSFNIPRIAQMTQKTNQFNLTTYRYTDADITRILNEGGIIFSLSVKDKYGDSGITGCIIIKNIEQKWQIDSLLLSCRILGKGIENAFIRKVLSTLKEQDISNLEAKYIPTEKNIQVIDFYESIGFKLLNNAIEDSGIKEYEIDLNNANLQIESYYKINQTL